MKTALNWIQHQFACLCVLGVMLLPVLAFPPAPHHRFFGQVRDEQGYRLSGDDVSFL